MASIERTAYPRFKRHPSTDELEQIYTPTDDELSLATRQVREPARRLSFLLLLKGFQRLGYFPVVDDVPLAIMRCVRDALRLSGHARPAVLEPRTLYRYHAAIRRWLGVTAFRDRGMHVAARAMGTAAQVMDHPADLINASIEQLIKDKIELPAFSTLDRMARRIRALVNQRLFNLVQQRLSPSDISQLDALLDVESGRRQSPLQLIKQLPKRSSLQHFQRLIEHIARLSNLVGEAHLLAGVPETKIKHFAAEAKALDAAELRDFGPPKRHLLLLSLIHRARIQARDDLAAMYIKRMNNLHRRGKEELDRLRVRHREKTETIVATLTDVIQVLDTHPSDTEAGREIRQLLSKRGGIEVLQEDCAAINAYSGDNYYPLLWKFFKSHRPTIYRMVRLLELSTTSEDRSLVEALALVLEHESRRGDWIDEPVDLAFANERWRRVVSHRAEDGTVRLHRRHLEVCVFSCLANELKTGDMAIGGSEEYADYRGQLLTWDECESRLADYCGQLGLPADAALFVAQLREELTRTAEEIDAAYPDNNQIVIDDRGVPVLKRVVAKEPTESAKALETAILQRMPERNILDILCNVAHWVNFPRHFGPLSGSDPKLERATERYVLTTFTYGSNLGPVQAARHFRGAVTPHMLSFVNRRHINGKKLDLAIKDIINAYNTLHLPKVWGDGKSAAADGTKYDMRDQSLMAEYHIRYGGYGGIAYHHVSDTYVALFSHFIPSGVWEAIYIIEGLLKNKSDIQPDTVHADTQGQSAPVFALSHLLGIKLMPRIRNWQDLKFFRPSAETRYEHIDSLFKDTIDWALIETHWKDLMRVVLSITAGKISSVTLLRKLGNNSRKNRLYQAFRELGRVVRTNFLLRYISDLDLREKITASTNKVEAYNGFAKWNFFGGEGVIADNDPEEQEKTVKYNDLVTNAIIFSNAVDLTRILRELATEGLKPKREDVAIMSPYMTGHIKRFGDYLIDIEAVPDPFVVELMLE